MENNYKIAKYLFIVDPSVCTNNGKDPAATELLGKMKAYGEVVPFEKIEAAIRAEDQSTIDRLTKKILSMQDQELTEEEIIWLNFLRERKAIETANFEKQIAARDKVIDDVRADSQKRAEQLAAFAEQLREMAN